MHSMYGSGTRNMSSLCLLWGPGSISSTERKEKKKEPETQKPSVISVPSHFPILPALPASLCRGSWLCILVYILYPKFEHRFFLLVLCQSRRNGVAFAFYSVHFAYLCTLLLWRQLPHTYLPSCPLHPVPHCLPLTSYFALESAAWEQSAKREMVKLAHPFKQTVGYIGHFIPAPEIRQFLFSVLSSRTRKTRRVCCVSWGAHTLVWRSSINLLVFRECWDSWGHFLKRELFCDGPGRQEPAAVRTWCLDCECSSVRNDLISAANRKWWNVLGEFGWEREVRPTSRVGRRQVLNRSAKLGGCSQRLTETWVIFKVDLSESRISVLFVVLSIWLTAVSPCK